MSNEYIILFQNSSDYLCFSSFKTEEDCWLNQQRLFLRQNNIDIDALPLKDFFLFSLGVPMPPNFFKVAQLAMMEKMQLTLKNSTEFQELTSGQQNLVLERNSTLALYFTQAKLELAKV